ncbi:MAG: hypothetical protein ACRDH9_06280 [Actinomycetota bacterium]
MAEPDSGPYEPIEGISLEKYARVAVELHRTTQEKMDEAAEALGIPAGRLTAIAEGWNKRMTDHPEVVHKYSELYQKGMKDAGIEAPDISIEQYADILRQGRTRPITEILPEFGLNMQTFAMVSGQWIEKMSGDPQIAAKLAGLMGDVQQPPAP